MKDLAEHIGNKDPKPILLLDNASAHLSYESRDVVKRFFVPWFIPPYSCAFNSIEHVWSSLKLELVRRFSIELLTMKLEEELRSAIRSVAETFT